MADNKIGLLGYCNLVARVTVHNAISRASFIIAIISFITGATIWLVPNFGMSIDASGLVAMLHNPVFYAAVVVLIIIYNFICAQYWIWKDDQKTIAALKAAKLCKKSAAEVTAIINALEKAHAAAVMLVANTLPDSDFHRNRLATWTMDTLRMMKQLDMPKHEIFCFQNPAELPDQDKCLRERQQLLRSLVEQYMRWRLE